MDLDIRPITEEEFPDFSNAVDAAFGRGQLSAEEIADWRGVSELDRTLAVFDRGRIVGTAGIWSMELTVPGGSLLPVAGVTAVGVRATHRRRGILTAMMDRQLDDVVQRGEPVAILTASESAIYSRFGYGPATFEVSVSLDSHWGGYKRGFADSGSLEQLSGDEAAAVLSEVHDRARRLQPGDISRSQAWWELFVRDRPYSRDGAGPAFFVVHRDATGTVDGWVVYRIKSSWRDGLPDSEARIMDLAGTTAEAELALWRHVMDVDLVTRVSSWGRPTDEVVRKWLADPRRMRTTTRRDDVWVRLLDIPAALGARTYGVEGEIVLEVTDPFRPHCGGRFRVAGGPAGAECGPTKSGPDLTVDVSDLGAGYLGEPSFNLLARAGRVVEHRTGAARRADLLFGTEVAPFCRTAF
ncbi:MAG TPA: GNAT family N-acetyltransferase [Acidimicrobiales bacterium]|nr:GNAT family N-acetyltransferase [Acidimicrobiales bacterium]